MGRSLFYQGGTLVLDGLNEQASVPAQFRWIKGRWRCEGYHYGTIAPWLREHRIRDSVARWKRLKLKMRDTLQPHDYQVEALNAWDAGGRRGSIVLPTGAGKTFVALQAITRIAGAAVVVAPTIDLLHQWYARLVNAFATEIGVYYGGGQNWRPVPAHDSSTTGELSPSSA